MSRPSSSFRRTVAEQGALNAVGINANNVAERIRTGHIKAEQIPAVKRVYGRLSSVRKALAAAGDNTSNES